MRRCGARRCGVNIDIHNDRQIYCREKHTYVCLLHKGEEGQTDFMVLETDTDAHVRTYKHTGRCKERYMKFYCHWLHI